MNNKNRKFIALSALACLGFFSVSCSKGDHTQQMPPMELPVATVEKGNGVSVKEYPASVEGVADVEIRPQVSGYLQKIFVDEGDYVRAGQPLFKIEDRIYSEQYNTAKAAIAVARANIRTAKIDLDRKKELVSEKIVSNLQVQQAQATYDSAQASLSQAEASAQSARINYEFCTIKAPVSGYLSRINYRLGSLIGPTSVQPISILSDIHEVNVYFSMSEADFMQFQNQYPGANIDEKIKNSSLVGLKIANGKMYDEKGKIDAVEGQFNANTGSVTFRAKFKNPATTLRAGNTGSINIEQNFEGVTLIPIASTTAVQDKVYVFSLDKDNKAIQKPLTVTGKIGTNYVVTAGLLPGEKYIVSGFERLQPGMPVIPKGSAKPQAKQTTDKQASGKS